MLYNLIKTERGKDTVVMTDTLPKVNSRMKTLRSSQRKKKITYRTEKTEDNEKFKQKPHNYNVGGSGTQVPRLKKWDK